MKKYPTRDIVPLKETDNRATKSLKLMIRNLRNIFGDEFWENTIVEITHYAFDNNARNKRKYV